MQLAIKTYAEVLDILRPADLLLYSGPSRMSKAIQATTSSPYSHAGLVGFNGGIPYILDMCEGSGGRAVQLRNELTAFPRGYELFRTDPENRWPEFDRGLTEAAMWSLTGIQYGKKALLWAFVRYLPFWRWTINWDKQRETLENLDMDDPTLDFLPFCSMAASWAFRRGHLDPVNLCRDAYTTPSHLSMSKVFSQYCALTA